MWEHIEGRYGLHGVVGVDRALPQHSAVSRHCFRVAGHVHDTRGPVAENGFDESGAAAGAGGIENNRGRLGGRQAMRGAGRGGVCPRNGDWQSNRILEELFGVGVDELAILADIMLGV
eukprot:GHVU01104465.1.p1 GENE.GHVU01104465.1~~GHVU01104465.1.p1  ORF type:complete len:118 (+),score=2.38 GHVU01104465.1:285-638(+)